MKWQDFLEAFHDVSGEQIHTLRRSERLAQWPADQSFYLEIAKQMFPAERYEFNLRQRLVDIFRGMLYTDGRTLSALLHIAKIASDDPDCFGSTGVQALAGICCYFDVSGYDGHEELRPFFEQLAKTQVLSHNANRLATRLARPT